MLVLPDQPERRVAMYRYFVLIVLIVGSHGVWEVCGEEPYPSTTIQSRTLLVPIYLPDADTGYYRGTRFEWSGMVERVKALGHDYFGPWKTTHDPNNHDDVNAIASEFGMNTPLGYAEAKPGDLFAKIGVGLLQKTNTQAYQFAGRYPLIEPFAWTVSQGDDWIEFRQEVDDFKGWGYAYSKRIVLDPDKPVMTVFHEFTNRGVREINTDYYCHNFTMIDGDPIDQRYHLEFSFPVSASNTMKGFAACDGNGITILKPVVGSFHTFLTGWEQAETPNQVTILNRSKGAGVQIRGSAKPHQFALWTTTLATCPEPFIPIHLQAGESAAWHDEYTFFVTSSTP
jgi:hypothetical protein